VPREYQATAYSVASLHPARARSMKWRAVMNHESENLWWSSSNTAKTKKVGQKKVTASTLCIGKGMVWKTAPGNLNPIATIAQT
jgi:hypothetical protein